jgi:hypothetical protein
LPLRHLPWTQPCLCLLVLDEPLAVLLAGRPWAVCRLTRRGRPR